MTDSETVTDAQGVLEDASTLRHSRLENLLDELKERGEELATAAEFLAFLHRDLKQIEREVRQAHAEAVTELRNQQQRDDYFAEQLSHVVAYQNTLKSISEQERHRQWLEDERWCLKARIWNLLGGSPRSRVDAL